MFMCTFIAMPDAASWSRDGLGLLGTRDRLKLQRLGSEGHVLRGTVGVRAGIRVWGGKGSEASEQGPAGRQAPRLPSFRASGTTSISALSGTRTQWQNDVARVTVLPPYPPLLMYAWSPPVNATLATGCAGSKGVSGQQSARDKQDCVLPMLDRQVQRLP